MYPCSTKNKLGAHTILGTPPKEGKTPGLMSLWIFPAKELQSVSATLQSSRAVASGPEVGLFALERVIEEE